jgi:hypothetical protein
MIERMKFSDVFFEREDGSISPILPITINGISMGVGVSFGRGVSMGGVNIFELIDKDLAIEKVGKHYVLKGYYNE